MATTTETYETIADLRAALPDLPEDAVIRDRDGDVERRGVVPRMEGRYAPYTVTYEVPDTPAPLDAQEAVGRIIAQFAELTQAANKAVEAARSSLPQITFPDHEPAPEPEEAMVSDEEREAKWEELVRKHEEEIVRLRGLNDGYVRDIAQWRQKCEEIEAAVTELAPEPEPEWKPGTVADITLRGTSLRAIRGDRPTWWTTGGGFVEDDEATNVRPLVVIDPAGVDWRGLQAQMSALVTGSGPFKRAGDILAVVRRELGIEATR